MARINDEVLAELQALRECGVDVGPTVIEAARGDLSGYDNMNVSDLADLLIMLEM